MKDNKFFFYLLISLRISWNQITRADVTNVNTVCRAEHGNSHLMYVTSQPLSNDPGLVYRTRVGYSILVMPLLNASSRHVV